MKDTLMIALTRKDHFKKESLQVAWKIKAGIQIKFIYEK